DHAGERLAGGSRLQLRREARRSCRGGTGCEALGGWCIAGAVKRARPGLGRAMRRDAFAARRGSPQPIGQGTRLGVGTKPDRGRRLTLLIASVSVAVPTNSDRLRPSTRAERTTACRGRATSPRREGGGHGA